jgi:pyruvyl transferase EpsO
MLAMNLSTQLEDVLGRLLGQRRQVVLLDFPNYANVGDSAIWLGQLRLLDKMGITVAAIADVEKDSADRLRSLVGDRVILIQGGGNFGDLWPRHQQFREQVAKTFPHNRLIQLPQSICFEDNSRLQASADVFRSHGDFHLLVRDRSSFEIGQQFAPGRTFLMPDAACCLPIEHQPGAKDWDLLLLIRNDKESTIGDGRALALARIPATVRSRQVDWPGERYGWGQRFYDKLSGARRREFPFVGPVVNRALSSAAAYLARARFQRGMQLIEGARVVVTDRLHAVIMSWLRGVPVFFVDNSYRKLSGYVDCWLADNPDVVRADSLEEATALALTRLGTAAARQ